MADRRQGKLKRPTSPVCLTTGGCLCPPTFVNDAPLNEWMGHSCGRHFRCFLTLLQLWRRRQRFKKDWKAAKLTQPASHGCPLPPQSVEEFALSLWPFTPQCSSSLISTPALVSVWGSKPLQGKRLLGCMMPGQRPNGELREQEASRRLLGSCHNSNKYYGLMCSSLPNEAQTKARGQRSSLPIRSAPETSPKCNLCTATELSMLSAGAEWGQSLWGMCVVMAHALCKVCGLRTFVLIHFFILFYSNKGAENIRQWQQSLHENQKEQSLGIHWLKLSSFIVSYHQMNVAVGVNLTFGCPEWTNFKQLWSAWSTSPLCLAGTKNDLTGLRKCSLLTSPMRFIKSSENLILTRSKSEELLHGTKSSKAISFQILNQTTWNPTRWGSRPQCSLGKCQLVLSACQTISSSLPLLSWSPCGFVI